MEIKRGRGIEIYRKAERPVQEERETEKRERNLFFRCSVSCITSSDVIIMCKRRRRRQWQLSSVTYYEREIVCACVRVCVCLWNRENV